MSNPNEMKSGVTDEMLRDMTRPSSDLPDNRQPLCYDQCVEGAKDGQVANTNTDQYQE